MSNPQQKLGEINGRLVNLFKADQPSMTAFNALSESAAKEGKVSSAMKELIAVAVAAARGCEDCVLYHVAQAKKQGADRETLVEVIAVTIEMSGGPGVIYAAKALDAYDNL
jgi:AhpD family alkylhydroperoxidase